MSGLVQTGLKLPYPGSHRSPKSVKIGQNLALDRSKMVDFGQNRLQQALDRSKMANLVKNRLQQALEPSKTGQNRSKPGLTGSKPPDLVENGRFEAFQGRFLVKTGQNLAW